MEGTMTRGRARLCIALLVLLGFALGASEFTVIGVETELAESFGVGLERVGELISWYSAAYAVLTPVLAVVTGRFRRYTLLLAYASVFVAANVVMTFAPTFELLLLSRVLLGGVSGALLAVGQGSARPPRLVVLEHAPEGHEKDKPLILVGKGITFDSGGISLKPAANMQQMKCDMTGAADVLAAIATLAEEDAPRRVIGLLACAENMPDGRATRPGDVVRSAGGDTVEITNTDAEGRLVLCDALAYAQKQWTPAAMVDIATLTGACAVALGTELAGLFCDDTDLAERIRAAGGVGGENYWRLPLWQPYAEQLKSEVADICHTGPREGGAINAALFLKHFVREGVRWAHLDIAGVDWNAKKSPLCPVGASGFGARTLLELARGGVQ